ncbi:MAG: hypothetical protein ACREOI_02945 [bacterium]
MLWHNPDEPEPKDFLLTEKNSHGISFRVPFHFREPDFFAFFAKISLVTNYARFSDKLKTGAPLRRGSLYLTGLQDQQD